MFIKRSYYLMRINISKFFNIFLDNYFDEDFFSLLSFFFLEYNSICWLEGYLKFEIDVENFDELEDFEKIMKD